MSDGKMVHVHLLDQANERALLLERELAQVKAELKRVRADKDTALRHVEAVLEWSNTERFAGRTRHEDDAPSAARAFLLSIGRRR